MEESQLLAFRDYAEGIISVFRDRGYDVEFKRKGVERGAALSLNSYIPITQEQFLSDKELLILVRERGALYHIDQASLYMTCDKKEMIIGSDFIDFHSKHSMFLSMYPANHSYEDGIEVANEYLHCLDEFMPLANAAAELISAFTKRTRHMRIGIERNRPNPLRVDDARFMPNSTEKFLVKMSSLELGRSSFFFNPEDRGIYMHTPQGEKKIS